MRTFVITLTFAMLVGAASIVQAISCGDSLGPGGRFTLTENLNCPGQTALFLQGGVTLDLNGKTITGTFGNGIVLTGERNTVKNGFVTGYGTAIQLAGSGRHKIINTLLFLNGEGINIGFNSNGNTVRDNAILNNTSVGIFVTFSSLKNRISGNTTNNNSTGISVQSPGNSVSGNTSNGNAIDGIQILNSGNTISANTTNLNTANGIRVVGFNNTITRNTSTGNGNADFITAQSCSDNTWRGNIPDFCNL